MSTYKTSTAGILNITEQKMMTKTQFVATMIIIIIIIKKHAMFH